MKPKTALKAKKPLRGKKRLRAIGKVGRQWYKTRQEWIAQNLPDDGYWICYLQIHPNCPKKLTLDLLTLDHIIPRSKKATLRFDHDNLAPACQWCNEQKASKVLTID